MKKWQKLMLFIFYTLIIVDSVNAETYTAFANIIGVDNQGKGIVGNVTVEIQPGKGRVLVDTTPLQGIYTQNSERTAVEVASKITVFNFSDYDVIYSIMTPNAHVVDGPSAGGALTLATITAIEGKEISPAFAMTGTIRSDGSIGPVGEILIKAKAAVESGVTVFLIPEGQAIQNQYVRKVKTPAPGWYIETIEPVPVNIIEYVKENWGLTVHEVSDINQVMKYAFGEIPSPKERSIEPLNQNISLPQFTSPVESYNEFYSIINDKISRAENTYKKTSRRLDSSNIPLEIKQSLETLLEKSEEYIKEAKQAEKMGYLYSAGNEAFRSLINSNTINDLIDYYSTPELRRNSFLEEKLEQIKKDVADTKQDVIQNTEGTICDSDNFEWAVAARQRVIYAENKVNSIELQPFPIVINGKSIGSDHVGMFFDINTAKEWLEISNNFMKKTDLKGNSTCLVNFKDDAEKIILDAEDELSIAESLGVEDIKDVEWFLQAAKKEFSEGWYITAIYDATSAKTRASITSKCEGKNINEIYNVFNETQFTTEDLLGTISFEYSHFLMYRAIKDESKNLALQAIESLQIGREINDKYLEIRKELVKTPFSWSLNIEFSSRDYTLILIIIVFFFGVYILSLWTRVKKLEEKYERKTWESRETKLKKIQDEIRISIEKELKRRLKKGEITKKEYEKLKKNLLK